MPYNVGDKVEIMDRGNWVGPYTVESLKGRTSDHLILRGQYGTFEHFNDGPFNIRPYSTESK